ncbi:hypothetical protein POM88_047791 [Heracleum sosnowskyi]|uniref:Cytochrome P450 n=1 Tax=Heracleum sosnowskyi TaxID=360622 RepID=A0AAD8GUV0_9APIA|nr:hypothetical protein POM88_047791 [Heracleum sosnowskyi]
MDAIELLLPCIIGFVALLVLHSLWSSRTNNLSHKKEIQARKANGAWPILSHLPLLAGPDPYRILGNIADKFGPIFRIQLGFKQALVVSSKEAVMQTTNDINFMSRPDVVALKYMGFYGGFYALAPYGPFWQEMRRISIHELLSNTHVELLKPVLFNIMLQGTARKRYSSIGKDASDEELMCLKRAYEDFFVILVTFQKSKGIPFTRWMKLQENWAMKRTEKVYNFVLSSWIDDHKQRRGKQGQLKEDGDFIDALISSFEGSDGFIHGHKTDDVIKATISGLLFTGTDTNHTTITWALALVLSIRKFCKEPKKSLTSILGRNDGQKNRILNN